MYEGDMVLKYQLIPEDLESLVSVRNDEDLRHMLEEYDRQILKAIPSSEPFSSHQILSYLRTNWLHRPPKYRTTLH